MTNSQSVGKDLLVAKATTQAVYERQAGYWHSVRLRNLYEKDWLSRFLAKLPASGRLLDLGCGTGDPIAKYFLSLGFKVVGADYAPSMIKIAQAQLPNAEWHVADIRALPVLGQFDGVYSWDGFFHLSVDEQREVLPKLAALVRLGGAIMLTVGTGEGEVTGTVGGEPVYHASLSPAEYEHILRSSGFNSIEYTQEDPDCLRRSVLLASEMTRPQK